MPAKHWQAFSLGGEHHRPLSVIVRCTARRQYAAAAAGRCFLFILRITFTACQLDERSRATVVAQRCREHLQRIATTATATELINILSSLFNS